MTKSRHRKSRWLDPILVAGPVTQIQHKFHPLYAFGFDGFSDRQGQVACVDAHVIVYALGGNVVLHSISGDKGMKFFSSSVAVEEVLWVEASPGGSLVAACEKLKTGHCQVSVIDITKLEAVNTFPATANGEFGACVFSTNERHFLAACNANHTAQLDYWDVRDGRVLLSTTVPYEVAKLSFNPLDEEEFAVSGPSYFKFWSIKGGLKKEIHVQGLSDHKDKATQEQIVTYTDHCWLVDTSVAVSSANGKIFIIRNYALQHVVTNTGNTLCLLHTHRGFLAGKLEGSLVEYIGFDLYKVKVAEKEQKNPYAEVRPVGLLSGLSPIASLVMPPGGEQIIYIVEGDKILKVHLGIGDDEDALLGADNSARISPLSVFRMGKISGIDICSQRMLLVTCGSDCALRVWCYQRMLCEICHMCDEEPFLVTISPWGHYLFVAMARRIQIFRIVGYKLQHCKDIGGVKNIKQLKFSPSGHLVAAANSREILIICAHTWKIKATLKGHTGAVTALAWSPDSIYIISAGLDGAIYGWFLDGYHRYLEYVVKGSVYSCLLVDQQRTFILACGTSVPVRVIDTDKKMISHGKEFSVLGEKLMMTHKDSTEALNGCPGTNLPTPERGHTPRSSSISPTSDDPINQPPAMTVDSPKEGPGTPRVPNMKRRDSTVGTEENPEGSWVQHKYRSNCMFELTHEKHATLMAALFKTGLLVTAAPGGELRMFSYPFQRDAPNLLKEVVLLTTGDITGLCLDEDRRLIFACTTQGSIFISTVDLEVVGPKVEDPDEDETVAMQEPIPVIPGVMQYLQDTGTDALNILLERDEVEEMKRDLQELKLTMAREVKDASFRAQRAALDWAVDLKEKESGYLEREKEYEVQVKLLSHNLHLAVSDKETAIQELLDAQRSTVQQLEDFYQTKLAQELERSHISRKQFQKDLVILEMEMKDKEQIYLEKMVALERELEGVDAAAQEAIKKVRDECNIISEHYKIEMEEDLLLSDEELVKAREKLNADVKVEKDRADENFEQLLLEKRHVMQVEKKMKDLQAVHSEHVELIEKFSAENAELKKTIMELDYEKRMLKKVVLVTDEKTQHLVHERKDQETKTIVRDFKIQQMRKREQPLEREAAQLRFQLREMERHQLSHVMEMKHQTLIVDNLKARLAAVEDDSQKLADQLHERENYVDIFTRALCQVVQEHDVSEWPQLIKQLYINYVKDWHRSETLDHLDAFGEVMHQRANLEKFVAILQREISRSEVRNWRETQKYMEQNLDMLHEYNEGQRNTKRLAFMTQKLQGDVTYWKAVAAKPERRLRATLDDGRPTKTAPQLEQSNSISRCSKSTRKSTPSSRVRASLVSSAELSRASSPGLIGTQLSEEEEKVKEQFRSSTPVAHILKPYLHRGSIPAAATSRYSFIQNRPWSPEPQSDKDKAIIVDLNILVSEMKKELRKKDEIIQQLQRESRLSTTSNYLPRGRSQSLFDDSSSEELVRPPGVQFSESLFEEITPIEETLSRRPKSVPILRRTSAFQVTNQKPPANPKVTDFSDVLKDMTTSRDPFLSGEKLGTSWVPRTAEALDLMLSSELAKAKAAATPTGPISIRRRASSPTGMGTVSTVIFDGGSLDPQGVESPIPRRSVSPTGPNQARIDQPMGGIHLAQRRASSPVSQPQSPPDLISLRMSSSPNPPGAHPRILSLQIENSTQATEKLTGMVEALPPVLGVAKRRSLSPPLVSLSATLPTLPKGSSPGPGNDVSGPQPPDPSNQLTDSTPASPQLATTSGSAAGAKLQDAGAVPPAAFQRRKSSLMIVETADPAPGNRPGEGPEPIPRRKSTFAKGEPTAGTNSGAERRGSTFLPAGVNTQRRKSSRFETTFLGSQVVPNISELHGPPGESNLTKRQPVLSLPGGVNNSRRASTAPSPNPAGKRPPSASRHSASASAASADSPATMTSIAELELAGSTSAAYRDLTTDAAPSPDGNRTEQAPGL
ncbi:unnamed protein product [Calypogeia fissa]